LDQRETTVRPALAIRDHRIATASAAPVAATMTKSMMLVGAPAAPPSADCTSWRLICCPRLSGPPLKTAPPEGRKVIAPFFELLSQKLQYLKFGAALPPSTLMSATPPDPPSARTMFRYPVGMAEYGCGRAAPQPSSGPKLVPLGNAPE